MVQNLSDFCKGTWTLPKSNGKFTKCLKQGSSAFRFVVLGRSLWLQEEGWQKLKVQTENHGNSPGG